ncbi:MAG: hypothetical protein JNJ64_07540 [Flavobacteriales bacterium]|nr:hypothetical protein [Flavobacteriales bacterium]
MRPFLWKTLMAAVLCALVAVVLDLTLTWRAAGRQFERYADLHVIRAGKAAAEVVVIGNSRARYHYDARVIAARLGRPCYNLGMIGYPLLDQLGKLRYYLEHAPEPALVVVNVDAASWRPLARDTIIQYEQFLDDIRDPAVLDIVRHKTGFRPLDLLPWARYAGFPEYVLKIATLDTVTNVHAGFVASTEVLDPVRARQVTLPADALSGLDGYLEALRAHRRRYWPHARVAFVETPFHGSDSLWILRALEPRLDRATEIVVPVDLSWTGDPTLFMNRTHLNAKGAAHFSALVADSLRAKGW